MFDVVGVNGRMTLRSVRRWLQNPVVLVAVLCILAAALWRPAAGLLHHHHHGAGGMHRALLDVESADGRDVRRVDDLARRAVSSAVPIMFVSLSLVALRVRRRAHMPARFRPRKLLPSKPDPTAPSH
jgi:hypothetical protein